MISKLINFLQYQFLIFKNLPNNIEEIKWANIFHDTIKGDASIENLPLSPGRWAGNYSLLYVLYKILKYIRPNSIIELGMGESSKLISTFIENHLPNTHHLIVEHDENWTKRFLKTFKFSNQTKVIHLPLIEKNEDNISFKGYKNIETQFSKSFDFYLVDGPLGSKKFSRYDIYLLMKNRKPEEQFIILFDDCQRKGEMDTFKMLIKLFKEKNIPVFYTIFNGSKRQIMIVSEKYQFLTSI